jgi:hypothetical protein
LINEKKFTRYFKKVFPGTKWDKFGKNIFRHFLHANIGKQQDLNHNQSLEFELSVLPRHNQHFSATGIIFINFRGKIIYLSLEAFLKLRKI